jgi:hypothetical protein
MNDLKTEVSEKNEDPFKDMGFIKFWVVSTLFWMTFPISLAASYISIGSVRTKQLVKALVHDFLQTLFIILVVISVVIYFIYDYVSGLF